MKKIYFAHPMSTYGSEQEKGIISSLSNVFEVENPSDKKHQDVVESVRAEFNGKSGAGKKIMEYFVSVCDKCDACAVLPFEDGSWGAGVVKEAQSFLDKGRDVYKIIALRDKFRLEQVTDLSNEKCLSIEDTRVMLKKMNPNYKSSS